MKLALALAFFIALCASSPVPLIPGDNSHYVEGVSRYIWIPDGDGVPHLVDLHDKPSDDEDQRDIARNGANNQYWLFTRRNPTNRQVITHNNVNSIWASNYHGGLPIIVIVHGWRSSGTSAINPRLTAAFLHNMDCNVIVVDWNRLAGDLNYWNVIRGVPSVGQHIGDFLNWLINTAGGNWNRVHLVGFSLGAHAVGNAGRRVGNRPNRITGLDPAGPEWGGNNNALRASDGQYVECIHTDGGAYGIMDPICRANFYPNGGRHRQPGCGLVDNPCSHSRAYQLMESTVYSNHLIGRQCNTWNQFNNCNGNALHMGNAVWGKTGNGWYGLVTRDRWPF